MPSGNSAVREKTPKHWGFEKRVHLLPHVKHPTFLQLGAPMTPAVLMSRRCVVKVAAGGRLFGHEGGRYCPRGTTFPSKLGMLEPWGFGVRALRIAAVANKTTYKHLAHSRNRASTCKGRSRLQRAGVPT